MNTNRDFLKRLASEPMALDVSALTRLQNVLMSGGLDDEVDVAALGEVFGAARMKPNAPGSIAVIPFYGFVQQREDFWTRIGMAVSTEAFVREVQQAVGDPNVKGIVVDVDSPGGFHSGTPEAADALFALRGQKPMVTVSNTLMASAAYFIASQADEVVASPSSETGSIGVWLGHVDESKFFESMGVDITLISAGKYKVEGNPYEPLGDEAREALQSLVDDAYGQFVGAVARGRGVTPAAVKAGYGEGRALTAQKAKAAGLVDRVATLEQTIGRFGGTGRSGARAEVERERARLELV